MSTNLPVVAEKIHSELGASVASRWMNCAGSVQLIRQVPAQGSSAAADEGTAAHELAELSLRRGVDPSTFIGTTLNGYEVDEEMADFVRVYVDECNNYTRLLECDVDIEQRFNLASLNPPGPMFGTADFVWAHPESSSMGIIDLKYGKGVVVEVKGNKQLRYYALGAVIALGAAGRGIDKITMTIVQPRAAHADGVVRSETITMDELLGFAVELLEAARATQQPGAPLKAGKWCRFCPASAVCPEQRAQAQLVAQTEFDAMPLDVPPDPATLPMPVLLDIMDKLPVLDQWMKDVRGFVLATLERGEEVPGYKLVAKRATRTWLDASETEQWLKAEGRQTDEIFDLKMKSPAQIEKLVGKKNLPSELVVKKSSGYTMAPAHDVRPAVILTPGDEFASLPSGEENDT